MYAFGAHVKNGGRLLRFGLALLVFAILALVTLASCQSSKSHNPLGFTTDSDSAATGLNSARTLSIEQAVANVQAYEPPGEVGVPDITPIAQNYLASTTDGQGNDVVEAWIDGDGTQYPYATFLVDADTDAVATDFQTLNYVATDQTGTTWSDVVASEPPGTRSPSGLDRTLSEEPLEGAQLIKTVNDSYGFNSYTARIYYASSGSNVTVEAHCEASEVSPGFPFGIRKTASKVVRATHWIPGYVIKVEASCILSEGIHLTAVVTFMDYLNKVRVVTLKEWDYFNFNGEDDEEEEEE